MTDTPGADWVEQLMRQFRDKLTGALYEGIYTLDEPELTRVLDVQAETCVHAFAALADIPPDLPFDAFIERMKTAGPGAVRVDHVSDDELLWTELHHGECVCPHVRQGVIRLDPKLCLCGETWVRLLVERHARRRATVTMVESVATGSQNCIYRIGLGEAIDKGELG